MRALDESREILYVIRTLDVLMSSGVGLEAAIHSMAKVVMELFPRTLQN